MVSDGVICPYMSSPKQEVECIKHRCMMYVQIMGMDPQTGEQLNQWGCAIAFMPMLQIEAAQMSRQTGAAVESLRNVVVDINSAPARGPIMPTEPNLALPPSAHLPVEPN